MIGKKVHPITWLKQKCPDIRSVQNKILSQSKKFKIFKRNFLLVFFKTLISEKRTKSIKYIVLYSYDGLNLMLWTFLFQKKLLTHFFGKKMS